MSYFVVVTFDIKDRDSEDYRKVYEDFEKLGLKTILMADSGVPCTLPTTTTAGAFEGTNVEAVRDDTCDRTEQVFKKHGLKGEIFVFAGASWAWGIRSP